MTRDVLAFASAADRARAVTVDSAGSSPSSHPAEGVSSTTSSSTRRRLPYVRRKARAHGVFTIGARGALLPPRSGGHAAHALRAPRLRTVPGPATRRRWPTPVCPLCSVAISNCVRRRPAATSSCSVRLDGATCLPCSEFSRDERTPIAVVSSGRWRRSRKTSPRRHERDRTRTTRTPSSDQDFTPWLRTTPCSPGRRGRQP